MSTVTLFVDDYQIDELCDTVQSVGAKWQDADVFRTFAGHLGDQVRLHALINRHNSHSLAAYSKADYHLHVMNGERSAELHALIQRALHQPLPDQLIVISNDPVFLLLYSAYCRHAYKCFDFSPTNRAATCLMQNGFDVRPFSSLMVSHRFVKKAYALRDIENMLYPITVIKGTITLGA
ncbi:MAG TPA: hypothetical protein P5121_23150, partial [Caldilineaceae bacterium]|nr:hypothetical protein [Caldilineaceae bacterium]